MKHTTINDCRIIDLRKISDPRGNLTPIEGGADIPFDINNDFTPSITVTNLQGQPVIDGITVSEGTITIDDGTNKKSFTLNRPYQGLLIVPGIWRVLDDFSSGAVLLCLASEYYIEEDYIRNYREFKKYKR